MKKRSALAVTSVLTSLLAFGAPATSGPPDWGTGCAMVATSTNGYAWYGTITGGPWFSMPTGAPVMMTCELQQLVGDRWETIAFAQSPLTPGVAVVPPTPVGFTDVLGPIGPIDPIRTRAADVPTNLQMCTQITVFRDPTTTPDVYPVDADDNPNNGAQCEKEERAENELVYVTVFPPHPHGRPCVWIDDSDLPDEVPGETCVI